MMSYRYVTLGIGLICVFALFVFAKVSGGFLPWFLFYVFIVLILYELCCGWFTLRTVEIERRVSAYHLSATQALEIEISISRNHIWPMYWAKVCDELPEPLFLRADNPVQIVMPFWSKHVLCKYRITQIPRGIYHLGDTYLESGDIFGIQKFSQRFHHFRHNEKIVVYPHVVPVHGWNRAYAKKLGKRRSITGRLEESANVIGVCKYIPGDKLSRIHWPASARTGILQAKEFELHVESDWVFVLDTSQNSFLQNDGGQLFDLGMTITASLMRCVHDAREKFRVEVYTNQFSEIFTGGDQSSFLRCMDVLAELKPICSIPFAKSFARMTSENPSGRTFIIISPDISKEMAAVMTWVIRRSSIEWFAPILRSSLTADELNFTRMLQANRVPIHLISRPEQLSTLERGGMERG